MPARTLQQGGATRRTAPCRPEPSQERGWGSAGACTLVSITSPALCARHARRGAQRLPRDRGPGAPSVPRRAPPPLPPHTGAAHALALLVQRACAKGWVRAAHVSLPASPHSQRLPVATPPGCVELTRPAAASVEPFTCRLFLPGTFRALVRNKRPGPSVRGLRTLGQKFRLAG